MSPVPRWRPCPLCGGEMHPSSERRHGHCGSSYCEGWTDGAESGYLNLNHREAIAGCVSESSCEHPMSDDDQRLWRSDLGALYHWNTFHPSFNSGCTADDAVLAEAVR